MNFFLLKSFFPEFFLSICILLQLVYNGFLINNLKNKPIIVNELFIQSFLILGCVFLLFLNLKCEVYSFNFLFINDLSCITVKIFITFFSILVLILVTQTFSLQKLNFFEYFILYLFTVFSSLLLVSVSDMIIGYLLLEMQALAFYVLSGFNRSSIYSVEAGIKYFITGSFISGIFLIGCVVLYGVFGTLNFVNLCMLLPILKDLSYLSYLHNFALLGYFFIVITFLLKLAIAPFHFWAADVYDGAPFASTIILMLLPKIALIYFFIKWLLFTKIFFFNISFILEFVGFLSIIVGALSAIRQFKLKRLIIYSSIGQLGFIIISISDLSLNSLTSLFFFLITYLIGSLAFWFFTINFMVSYKMIQTFYGKSSSMLFINSLNNGFKVNSGLSYAYIIIFSSFAGLPPFSGFFAKYFVLCNTIADKNSAIIIIILFANLVSAFYYLRILKIIFYEPKNSSLKDNNFQIILETPFLYLNSLIGTFLLFLILYFFYNPVLLYLICQKIILGLYFF